MDGVDLTARIRTTSELLSVVQAMRTLAGARVRQAQENLAALERYAEATRASLAYALAVLGTEAVGKEHEREQAEEPPPEPAPAPGARRVVVLFSEHGFVGTLNERLLGLAEETAHTYEATLMAAGRRGLRLCRDRGVEVADMGSMPTTATTATATAQRLVDDLFGAIAKGSVTGLALVFARHDPPVGWTPLVARLFPPDVAARKLAGQEEPPIRMLPAPILVAQAIEEYAFAQLCSAVVEAVASESAARLVAMDTSRRHIDDKLSDLRRLERATRQELVTNEILEVACGAASVRGEGL